MFTPSSEHPLARLDEIAEARRNGVGWDQIAGAGPVPDPLQLEQARLFLQFRSHLPEREDDETRERASRILLAGQDAPSRERVWGLPDDPADPRSADFSDLARSLDEGAEKIHTPPRYNGGQP